jgi:ribosomal protein S18 acetylase RimI-like enzyme
MKATIRKMSIQDYAEVSAFWAGIAGLGIHLEDVDSREYIKRYLVRNPGLSFVARSACRVIGTVLCGHDGRRGILYHLAVDPDYRELGVGRDLVNHCLRALAKAGINKCYIFIFSNNTKAKSFWRKIGWSRYEGLDAMYRFVEQQPKRHRHNNRRGGRQKRRGNKMTGDCGQHVPQAEYVKRKHV